MLTFQVERWGTVKDELPPIIHEHWDEMGLDPSVPLELDSDMYQRTDERGGLLIVTAREGEALVGYFFNFIARHPHYDLLTAAMDVYFLLPEYRKGSSAVRMFRMMERACEERGVQFMLATARMDRNPGAGALFRWLGWTPARTVYQKRLN